MNSIYKEKGFLSLDMMLLSIILLVISLLWGVIGFLSNVQKNEVYRQEAIFLLQGYLNEMEYQCKKGDFTYTKQEKINYHDKNFTIIRELIKESENIYIIKIKIQWQYENVMQYEYQKRQIVARK